MRFLPTLRKREQREQVDNTLPGDLGPIGDSWLSWFQNGVFGDMPMSPRLLDRVWVANRCQQLNAQQIASMPLRFFGTNEPAWVANPDPVWFPNGIGDAVFAAIWSMYGWGDAFLLITSRYANGYPSNWTVLDPASMSVTVEDGVRVYESSGYPLNAEDVVQVTRDPRGNLRGTSALRSYASMAWGALAAVDLGRSMLSGGGIPNAVLKSQRKLNAAQARALQDQWVAARARSQIGAPAVLPPEIDFEQLQFSAGDIGLLDLQEYDARSIATAYGVPAFMLNIPVRGGLVYQNPQMLFEVWWRSELRPCAGRLQRALSANMLPRGNWVEFDARAVLAPTFSEQVTSWLALEKEGVVTKDEVRAAVLHLPPSEQGEAIDELTEPPTAAASPADGTDTGEEAIVQELRPSMWSSYDVTVGGVTT